MDGEVDTKENNDLYEEARGKYDEDEDKEEMGDVITYSTVKTHIHLFRISFSLYFPVSLSVTYTICTSIFRLN